MTSTVRRSCQTRSDGCGGSDRTTQRLIHMNWKTIAIIVAFLVGGWLLGRLMTGSGRNMDDGGPGS